MVSLKDCDYKEFLGMQPVRKSYLENLREKVTAGYAESEGIFKKQIYSLAAYIAQKHTCEYVDMDYLFSHIDTEELKLLSQTNLFFYFPDKESHIHAFETEIRTVIDRLYVTALDDKLIAKEQYEKVKKARKVAILSDEAKNLVFDDIPGEIIVAVNENEDRIEREEALESNRFNQLKYIIRECSDLSYREKLNLLSYLLKKKHDREFFYCLFGIDKGMVKSPEEAASGCQLSANNASETFRRIIHTDMSLFTYVPMSHGCIRYTVSHDEQELIDFLCENEQNRKEHDRYLEKLEQNRPPLRKHDGLRDYLD